MNSPTTVRNPGLRGFLAGVALVLSASIGIAAWAGPHGGPGGPTMSGSPERMVRMIDRMLDSASATDAQRTQIRQIVQAAADDMKAQHEAGKALRDQQMSLFTQPTVDANAVEALRQQMLVQHDQGSRRMTQALLEISRVLTPEQRMKLAERMKSRGDMMRRHHDERMQLNPKG
jgi:Spy/CpxP family protein refolding chaperone